MKKTFLFTFGVFLHLIQPLYAGDEIVPASADSNSRLEDILSSAYARSLRRDYLASILASYHMMEAARSAASQGALKAPTDDLVLASIFTASLTSTFDAALSTLAEVGSQMEYDEEPEKLVMEEAEATASKAAAAVLQGKGQKKIRDAEGGDLGERVYRAAEQVVLAYLVEHGAELWDKYFRAARKSISDEQAENACHLVVWSEDAMANPYLKPYLKIINQARDKVVSWNL